MISTAARGGRWLFPALTRQRLAQQARRRLGYIKPARARTQYAGSETDAQGPASSCEEGRRAAGVTLSPARRRCREVRAGRR